MPDAVNDPPRSPSAPGETPIPMDEPAIAFGQGMAFKAYLRSLPPQTRHFMRGRAAWTRLAPEDQAFFATYPLETRMVILVSDEMPDSMLVTPVIHRIAQSGPRLSLSIVCDDMDLVPLNEMLEEMDLATDLEEVDLPLLFLFDEEWHQVGTWGPRPRAAEERLEAWMAAHPNYAHLLAQEGVADSTELHRLMAELIVQMSLWYNDDLTQATVDELRELLAALADNGEADG